MKENKSVIKSQFVSYSFLEMYNFILSNMNKENTYGNFNGVFIVDKDNKDVRVFITGDCWWLDDTDSGGDGVVKLRMNMLDPYGATIRSDTYFVPAGNIKNNNGSMIIATFINELLMQEYEDLAKKLNSAIKYRFESYEDYFKFTDSHQGVEHSILKDDYSKEGVDLLLETSVQKGYDNIIFTFKFTDYMYDLTFDIKVLNIFNVYCCVIRAKSDDAIVNSILQVLINFNNNLDKSSNSKSIGSIIDDVKNNYINDIIRNNDIGFNMRLRMWKGNHAYEKDSKSNTT